MQHEHIQAAAKALLERRLDNRITARLEPRLQPRTADEALAIQQAIIEQMNAMKGDAMDDTVGGWKCSLPIGDNDLENMPVVAPIFANSIFFQGDN